MKGPAHGEELWGQGCTQRPSGEGRRRTAGARRRAKARAWRRARSARADVSCTRGVREVMDLWGEVMGLLNASVCVRGRSRWVTGARALTCCRRRGGWSSRLPVPWEPEVFLSMLRERAGRLDMVSAAGRALDSAMRWDCGHRRKLRGRCCLGCCCRDRQLQADGGGFRSFRQIRRDIEVAVVAGRGAQRRAGVPALRRCRNLQWWCGVEASSALPEST